MTLDAETETYAVESYISEPDLVAARRRQIASAAEATFAKKGFHPTRVREIAEAAGVSIGTIYQYVRSKEDILFLVCEQGFADWEAELRDAIKGLTSPVDRLKTLIRTYYQEMFKIDDAILLMYQETKSLSKPRRKLVMQREEDLKRIFADVLDEGVRAGVFRPMDSGLAAHNILVLGQMWGTKRWSIRDHLGIDDFIARQTDFILSAVGADAETPNGLPVTGSKGQTRRLAPI